MNNIKAHHRNSKWILCTFSTLLWVFGVCMLGVGIWLLVTEEQTSISVTNQNLLLPSVLFMTIGGLYLLTSFLGCCGSMYENQCMTITCIVTTAIIIILESVSVALIFAEGKQILTFVHNQLTVSLKELYPNSLSTSLTDYQARVEAGWDRLQSHFKCCGVDSFSDWFTSYHHLGISSKPTVPFVPDSCCIDSFAGCVRSNVPLHHKGCAEALSTNLTQNLHSAAVVALILISVQLIISFGSCFFLHFMKRKSAGLRRQRSQAHTRL